MISLLTPISHLFKSDFRFASDIANASDWLEARERTADLRIPNTTHYHIDFDLNIGISNKQIDFLIEHVKGRDEITTLTFQAARDCELVKIKDGMYFPASPPISLKDQILNTQKSLAVIRDIVGTSRTIGIENNNFYPTGAYEISTSIEYLSEVISSSDIHLLLDIAHAKVSAYNLDISLQEYILPLLDLNKCKQVHICEPELHKTPSGQNIMKDVHGIPTNELTIYTIDLMKKYNIEYLTCEYYKNSRRLVEYLNYTKTLIK